MLSDAQNVTRHKPIEEKIRNFFVAVYDRKTNKMTSIFVPSCRMPEKSDLIVRCWCRPGAPPRNRVPSDKLCRLPNFFVCRTGRNASAGKMSPKRWSPGLPPLAIAIPYSHAMQNATIQVPPSPSSRKFRDYVPTHLLRFDNS